MSIRSDRKGFTLIELLIVVSLIGIISAIAVPGLMRARMSGNEASAIGSLRAINTAQNAYSSGCGNGFYAPDLIELGKPPTAGGAPFVGPDISGAALVIKSGYTLAVAAAAGAGNGVFAACTGTAGNTLVSGYLGTAAPVSSTTGLRFFGTSEAQTLFQYSAAITAINSSGVPTPAAAVPIQ